MAQKTTQKKNPHSRTCVGCRTTSEKVSLVRIVKSAEGIKIDLKGKMAGRGAYLHRSRSCWETGMKGPLARALKATLSDEDRNYLIEFMHSIPNQGNEQKTALLSDE